MVEHLRKTATVFFWSTLQFEKADAWTSFVMHLGTFRVESIFINNAISYLFAQKTPFDLSVLKHFFQTACPSICLYIYLYKL